MPRIAYLANDEKDFYKRLDKLMDIAARSLDTKRRVITKLMEAGLYPYTKRYLGTFENHFSTIGLIGMNEAALNANWVGVNMLDERARQFTKNVLNHMRQRLVIYQEMYGSLFNLEATPAESTTYRLAKHDVSRYPDIITASNNPEEAPYYTNSSHLPVGATDDMFEALEMQDELQTLYTSGTVFHAFIGEKLPNWQSAAALVRKIAENYHLPYYTISPTYTVCRTHGYIPGEHFICPTCGKPAEVYSRITGYYRPVKNWNIGKTEEFKDRKEYSTIDLFSDSSDRGSAKSNKKEDSVLMLFTTKTCANCDSAKKILDDSGVSYRVMDAAEHQDLVVKYGILQAPTLVYSQGDNAHKYAGLSSIMQYLKEAK
jgi:ribonucleoside-triphosphate reductase